MSVEDWVYFYSRKYGAEVAEKFRAWSLGKADFKQLDLGKLNEICVPSSTTIPHGTDFSRVAVLNSILGKPFGNIGWNCKTCNLAENDPSFFDVDHIIPRRKNGHGRKENLQILCPNCHRIKSRKEHLEASGK